MHVDACDEGGILLKVHNAFCVHVHIVAHMTPERDDAIMALGSWRRKVCVASYTYVDAV